MCCSKALSCRHTIIFIKLRVSSSDEKLPKTLKRFELSLADIRAKLKNIIVIFSRHTGLQNSSSHFVLSTLTALDFPHESLKSD